MNEQIDIKKIFQLKLKELINTPFINIYNNLKKNNTNQDIRKKYKYIYNWEEKYEEYTQNINNPLWNIQWRYIKRYISSEKCTISVSFYKKKNYTNKFQFEKYEYGLIAFFIIFCNMNITYDFKYNIRFYVNNSVKEILYYIIDSIFLYISYILTNGLKIEDHEDDYGIQTSLIRLIIRCYSKKIHKNIENTLYKILDNIEIYEYTINGLQNDYRSIGMFMRFLPFFYDSENNFIHYRNRVLVSDIDSGFRRRMQQFLLLLIDNNVNFGYTSRVGFEYTINQKCNKNRYEYMFPIINLFVYQYNINTRFSIFINYYKYCIYLLELENSNISHQEIINLKICGINKVFGYGHDEIFTNKYLLNNYINNQDIKIKTYIKSSYYYLFTEILQEAILKINNLIINQEESSNSKNSNNSEITKITILMKSLIKTLFNLNISLNNIENKNQNFNLKKFINSVPNKYIKEFQNIESKNLKNIYNNLTNLSKKENFTKKLSKILTNNTWKPNILNKYIKKNYFDDKGFIFYSHNVVFRLIHYIITKLSIHNIIISKHLIYTIYINLLIIDKYKYTNHPNNYNEYKRNYKKATNYYHHYIDIITENSKRKIYLTRYCTDNLGIILPEVPDNKFKYEINFDTGNIINLSYGIPVNQQIIGPLNTNIILQELSKYL
jgi:hypothetical protein